MIRKEGLIAYGVVALNLLTCTLKDDSKLPNNSSFRKAAPASSNTNYSTNLEAIVSTSSNEEEYAEKAGFTNNLYLKKGGGDVWGFYISSEVLANPKKTETLLKEGSEAGFNVVVADLKDSFDRIIYDTSVRKAEKLGLKRVIINPDDFVELCDKYSISVVWRMVMLHDKKLAVEYPYAYNGTNSKRWVDPANREVLKFYKELLHEVHKIKKSRGQESLNIQFDYIRYNDDYSMRDTMDSAERAEVIKNFLRELHRNKPKDVNYDIAVYGRAVFSRYCCGKDPVGQDIELLSPHVRFVLPMTYTSHQCPYYKEKPFEIVSKTIEEGIARVGNDKIVPYLQSFFWKIPEGMKYDDYIKTQLYAIQKSPINSFVFWNHRGDYDELFGIMKGIKENGSELVADAKK